jgi:hypothetical protein
MNLDMRRGPLALQIRATELTLLADDVNTLIEAARLWSDSLTQQREQARHERAEGYEVFEPLLETLASLRETLATAPSGLLDPPLLVDEAQLHLLRQLLDEMVGYQRRELTPGLAELKVALQNTH